MADEPTAQPEEEDDGKPEEEDDGSIRISYDGKTYAIHPDDVDGLERRTFRLETGFAFSAMQGLHAMGGLDDLEVAAGVIWLIRRREEPDLAFQEVLADIVPPRFTSASESEEAPPTD